MMIGRLEKLASIVFSVLTSIGVICAAVLFIWRSSAFMTEMEFRVTVLQDSVGQIQRVDTDARTALKKETDDRLAAMDQRILGLEAANNSIQTSVGSSAIGVATLQERMAHVQGSIDEVTRKLDALGAGRHP